jgi:hypothetical protein
MANTTIPLTFPTFPPGYCYPSTPQQLFNDAIINGASITIPGTATGSIVSPTAPASNARNLAWFKVDANNNLLGVFTFSQQYNLWVFQHPLPPAGTVNTATGGERRLYMGTLVGLQSYDGGDGGSNATIGDTTGPMWQQDTTWSTGVAPNAVGFMPIGAPNNIGGNTITNPGDKVTSNLGGGGSNNGVQGVFFIKRSARLYYTG